MKTLLVLLVALGALAGCDTRGKVLAPIRSEHAQAFATWQVVATEWTTVNGVRVKIETRQSRGQTVRVLYICDYPNGYYGPPAPGHCYEDGSACTGPAISDCRVLQCAPQLGQIGPVKGDPDPTEADTDGALQKSKSIADPDNPSAVTKGDPTADD